MRRRYPTEKQQNVQKIIEALEEKGMAIAEYIRLVDSLGDFHEVVIGGIQRIHDKDLIGVFLAEIKDMNDQNSIKKAIDKIESEEGNELIVNLIAGTCLGVMGGFLLGCVLQHVACDFKDETRLEFCGTSIQDFILPIVACSIIVVNGLFILSHLSKTTDFLDRWQDSNSSLLLQ